MNKHREQFGDLLPSLPIWDIAEIVSSKLIPAHPLGFTFDPRQLCLTAYNQHAHAVALDRHKYELKTHDKPSTSEIAKWLSQQDRNLLLTLEGFYIGYWFNAKEEFHCIDVTLLCWDIDKARALADEFAQISIYHPFSNKEIPVKSSHEDRPIECALDPIPNLEGDEEMPITHQEYLKQLWDGLKFAFRLPLITLMIVISIMFSCMGILFVAKLFGFVFQQFITTPW